MRDNILMELELKVPKINVDFLKKYYIYFGLFLTLIIGYYVRTRNVALLKGKYLLGLDPYLFFRYSKTIVETGTLPVIDTLRYVPLYISAGKGVNFTAYILAYTYKILHAFSSNLTLLDWHILYPAVFGVLGFVVFFFLVKELFNDKIALIATAFLAVIPAYIYRTSSGFADHEAAGMLFIFASFLFFTKAYKVRFMKKGLVYSLLSGFFTSVAMFAWGGGVNFILLVFSLFLIGVIFFIKDDKEDIYKYAIWLISFIIISSLIHLSAGNSLGFIKGYGTLASILALVIGLIYINIDRVKFLEKIKLPKPVIAVIIAGILSMPALFFGFLDVSKITDILLHPRGTSRWAFSVSENQQPYVLGSGSSWWSQFGVFFLIAFIGSVWLFYKLCNAIFVRKKIKIGLTISYIISFLAFMFGRLSPNPNLSGVVSFFSQTYLYWFGGFVLILFLIYIYEYQKGNITLNTHSWPLVLTFVWFLFVGLMARGAIRIIFAFAPIVAIVGAYFLYEFGHWLYKDNNRKIYAYILLIFVLIIFSTNAHASYSANKISGSGFAGQWENSMTWMSENTPKDAVFAHWWDYGYWVQTKGERATVLDGGNAIVYWNYLMGRYFLTGHSETEALEFFKMHNVTHALISAEEIGKFHAFSTIGANENFDRQSTIGAFSLTGEDEVRNGVQRFYQGGWSFDQDLVVDQIVLPKNKAGIGGFIITLQNNLLTSAEAVVVYNDNQYIFNVSCTCNENKCVDSDVENSLNGCIRFVPYIQDQSTIIDNGGAFYISEKTKETNFAKLYMFNQEFSHFEEVYNDGTPLGLYQGRIIGPIRIWEISYPDNLEERPEFLDRTSEAYEKTLPD